MENIILRNIEEGTETVVLVNRNNTLRELVPSIVDQNKSIVSFFDHSRNHISDKLMIYEVTDKSRPIIFYQIFSKSSTSQIKKEKNTQKQKSRNGQSNEIRETIADVAFRAIEPSFSSHRKIIYNISKLFTCDSHDKYNQFSSK